jgi:hypothetical protein
MQGTEEQIEVYKQHRASQEKYTYFLLAAAGAAIGFAVTQTKDLSLGYSQLPLAVAVVLWGFSFYFGCRHITHVECVLYSNAALLKAKAGNDPRAGTNPQFISLAVEGISSTIEENVKDAAWYGRWQFHCLIFGSVFYLGWHVYEMWVRGVALS